MSRSLRQKRDSIVIRLPIGARPHSDTPPPRNAETRRDSRFLRSPFAGQTTASGARVISLGRAETISPGVPQTRVHTTRTGWIIAIGVLFFAVLVSGAAYVYIKHETRQARFELTEMKQNQLFLIKERERLNRQISTYKRLDDIALRAQARGLEQPDNTKVVKLP